MLTKGLHMGISVSKASKDWKVSRTTIYNKVNSGKISKNNDGTVEVAEMVRVFGEPKKKVEQSEQVQKVSRLTQVDNQVDTELLLEKQKNVFLEANNKKQEKEIERLQALLEKSQDTIADLSQTVKLIENKNQLTPVEVKKPWWKWW